MRTPLKAAQGFGPAFAAVTLTLLLAASVFSQDGLALLRKMQDALGGADRIAGIHDLEQLVRAESWNGNTGESIGEVRKRTRWISPSTIRIDQIGPGSTYVLYFDGTSGWEIMPGTKEAIAITGGELEFAKGIVRGFRVKTWLADRDPRFRITSPAPHVVRVSDGDVSHQLDITVDPASSLPVKLSFITLSDPAHPETGEEVTTEWDTVKGIRFPHRWTVLRRGIRVAEAKDARSFVNTGLNVADLSAKPPDMKPVMPNF